MLTCKSLFGLGYRGERLIEPSAVVVDRRNARRFPSPVVGVSVVVSLRRSLFLFPSWAIPSKCRDPHPTDSQSHKGTAGPRRNGATAPTAKAAGTVTSLFRDRGWRSAAKFGGTGQHDLLP